MAGVLVLLISVTLILLKLGFLLLLIVGPFFLLIGTHPGFGRVVAVRWFEMLVGVLLKQAAVALALSVLLYCYALIMGTSDAVLPWALKILMITLVTVAVFIYRKPFQHLFAAVGLRRDRRDRPGRGRPQPGGRDRQGEHQGRGDARACPASPATGRPAGPGATRLRPLAWRSARPRPPAPRASRRARPRG